MVNNNQMTCPVFGNTPSDLKPYIQLRLDRAFYTFGQTYKTYINCTESTAIVQKVQKVCDVHVIRIIHRSLGVCTGF